jgi:hypothetical protein
MRASFDRMSARCGKGFENVSSMRAALKISRHGCDNLRFNRITKCLTLIGVSGSRQVAGAVFQKAAAKRAGSGHQEFGPPSAERGIEHCRTPAMRQQKSGMVGSINGRIEDVLQSHQFHSSETQEQILLRYVSFWNGKLTQSAVAGRSTADSLKDWQSQRPERSRTRIDNYAGCDAWSFSDRSRGFCHARPSILLCGRQILLQSLAGILEQNLVQAFTPSQQHAAKSTHALITTGEHLSLKSIRSVFRAVSVNPISRATSSRDECTKTLILSPTSTICSIMRAMPNTVSFGEYTTTLVGSSLAP